MSERFSHLSGQRLTKTIKYKAQKKKTLSSACLKYTETTPDPPVALVTGAE